MDNSQAQRAFERKSVLSLVPPVAICDTTSAVRLSTAKGWVRIAFSLVGAEVEIHRQERPKDPLRSARAKKAWERRKGNLDAQMELFGSPEVRQPITEPKITRRRSMDGPLRLLMVLRGLCRPDKKDIWSHASLETLAKRTTKSRRAIWEWLRILVSAGLIELHAIGTDVAGRVRHGGRGRATEFRLTELAWQGFPTGLKTKTAATEDRNSLWVQNLHSQMEVQDQNQTPPLPLKTGKVEVALSEAKSKPASEAPPKPDQVPGYRWHPDRIREDLVKRAYPADVVDAALVELASRPDVIARRNWTEAVVVRRMDALSKGQRDAVRSDDLRAQVQEITAAAVPEKSGYGGESGEAWARDCAAKKASGRRLMPWEVRAAASVNNNVLASSACGA